MHAADASLPVIDLAALDGAVDDAIRRDAVAALGTACRDHGFFYLANHGVSDPVIERLETLSHCFFALDASEKARWRMALGGRAWRGYFALAEELTSGRPDWKEGLYLGTELDDTHPLVQARTPMHGRNLFPDVPGLRDAVLAYMEAVTAVAHRVMRGIARSLGIAPDYFERHGTCDPLVLFRLFHYPSQDLPPEFAADTDRIWGVGEHTDYGLLTLLWQDDVGGLEVKTRRGWIDAPPRPGTFVCNLGDMLDRMTGGLYRSTPHRVRRNVSGRGRLSFPLFFDPAFDASIAPIPGLPVHRDTDATRWDGIGVHDLHGTYGDYLLRKVSKVFPQLVDRLDA